MRVTVMRALATALLLMVVAACTPTTDASSTSAELSAGPQAQSLGAVPADLERFYGQSLAWTSCDEFVAEEYQRSAYLNATLECAHFLVPVDYSDAADSDSPVLSLGVLRRKATGSARIGVVALTRGAMDLGTDLVAFASGPDKRQLNESFDLVGFDQRGMGASGPRIDCLTDDEITAMRRTDQRTATDAGLAAATAEAASISQGCAVKTVPPDGVDVQTYLGLIGTREAARDLDVLRSALGEDQLSLVGQAYGSRVAREYAEKFPDRVRAMILDGVASPGIDQVADEHAWYAAAQQAFDEWARSCITMTYCPLTEDPARAVVEYQDLVRPLLETPLVLPDGRTLGYDDALGGTLVGIGDKLQWPDLSNALFALNRGDGDALMRLADRQWGYFNGQYWDSLDAAVIAPCLDGPTPLTGEAAAQVVADGIRTAPFMDSGELQRAFPGPCDTWPEKTTLDTLATGVPGLPPTLVISTVGDIATPHQSGVELAAAWGVPLLTVAGTMSGGAYLQEITCVDDVGAAFLVSGQPLAADATC